MPSFGWPAESRARWLGKHPFDQLEETSSISRNLRVGNRLDGLVQERQPIFIENEKSEIGTESDVRAMLPEEFRGE